MDTQCSYKMVTSMKVLNMCVSLAQLVERSTGYGCQFPGLWDSAGSIPAWNQLFILHMGFNILYYILFHKNSRILLKTIYWACGAVWLRLPPSSSLVFLVAKLP